jgi:hypothetical protein
MGEATADAVPSPPRYRWTRRIAKGLLVTFILLFIVRIAWAWEARRRLNAAVRECRSPTRPLLAEDFARPPIPDEQNAAALIRGAAAQYVPMDDWSPLDRFEASQGSALDVNLVRAWLERNAGPLAQLRRTRDLPAHWGDLSPQSFITLLFSRYRSNVPVMAGVTHYAALLARRDGQHASAVEYWRDGCAVTRAAFAGLTWDDYYAGIRAQDTLTSAILRRVGQIMSDRVVEPAAPGQLRALLNDLLDERPFMDGCVRSLCAERLLILEYVRALKEGRAGTTFDADRDRLNPPTRLERAVIRTIEPALDLKAVATTRELTAAVAAFEQAHLGYGAVVSRLPNQKLGPVRTGTYPVDEMLEYTPIPHFATTARVCFQSLAQRRAAAVAVAVRLYVHDREGLMPGGLPELVPAYLPAVPVDPFGDGKTPLRYLTSPRPVVYSVGPDGIDDLAKGSWTLPRVQSFAPWNSPDAVFELQ